MLGSSVWHAGPPEPAAPGGGGPSMSALPQRREELDRLSGVTPLIALLMLTVGVAAVRPDARSQSG